MWPSWPTSTLLSGTSQQIERNIDAFTLCSRCLWNCHYNRQCSHPAPLYLPLMWVVILGDTRTQVARPWKYVVSIFRVHRNKTLHNSYFCSSHRKPSHSRPPLPPPRYCRCSISWWCHNPWSWLYWSVTNASGIPNNLYNSAVDHCPCCGLTVLLTIHDSQCVT